MEKNGSDQASSQSWWLDNHNRPHQSQWLQTTLAELDTKIKMILEVVEDGGDTFAQRAQMYYQRRPELIKMVLDLHSSYRALADKYDLLRTESLRGSSYCGSSSNSFRQNLPIPEKGKPENASLLEGPHFNSGLILAQHTDFEYQAFISELEPMNNSISTVVALAKPLQSAKQLGDEDKAEAMVKNAVNGTIEHEAEMVKNVVNGTIEHKEVTTKAEKEDSLGIMKPILGLEFHAKLVEENLRQQAELIKRNNEKRDSIKELINENRRLKELLDSRENNDVILKQPPRSSFSKLKKSVFGKLL